MKNKTAMQELFDNLEAIDITVPTGVKQIFLEKEKQQIIDSFEIGYDNGACVQEGSSIYHGGNYYNETFKQD